MLRLPSLAMLYFQNATHVGLASAGCERELERGAGRVEVALTASPMANMQFIGRSNYAEPEEMVFCVK